MDSCTDMDIGAYNDFCHNLVEGSILYNIDSTNLWGNYLLVANKAVVHVGGMKTYSLLLLGLEKEGGRYKPRDLRISLTPEHAARTPFLKCVGTCKFELLPVMLEVNVNVGLVSIYGEADLHKYTKMLNIRKPQKRKYDKNGKPVIKKSNN